jgi:hypothetical protein
MMLRRLSLIAIALAALAVSGCGGSDGSSTSTSTTTSGPLSGKELRQAANDLCSTMVERLQTEGTPPDLDPETLTPERIRATVPFWELSADAGQDTLDQLDGLQPPQADAKDWSGFLKLYEKAMIDYQRALASAAGSGDKSTFFTAAFKGQTVVREFDAAAAELGLDDCQTASASG